MALDVESVAKAEELRAQWHALRLVEQRQRRVAHLETARPLSPGQVHVEKWLPLAALGRLRFLAPQQGEPAAAAPVAGRELGTLHAPRSPLAAVHARSVDAASEHGGSSGRLGARALPALGLLLLRRAHVVPDRAAHVSGQALSRQRLARGSGRVALRSDAQRALAHVGKTRPCI